MLQKDILIEYTIYISYNMYISVIYIYVYIYEKHFNKWIKYKSSNSLHYLFYSSVCFYRLFLNII